MTALVRACPKVSFVLDRLGKPAIRERRGAAPARRSEEGPLDPWRDQLTALAALLNVACKLSGLVTEADHDSWQPADLAPYVAHALTLFGPDRVLFGSDWPVVTLASSYRQWVETLETLETLDALTARLSADDRRQLWSDNARRWYRLSLPVQK